jgi:hypothetical protein
VHLSTALDWGLTALISLAGLLVLRGRWRRAAAIPLVGTEGQER